MPTDVELIKSRVDLVELVQERVRLTRTSKGWKGRCPFHEDSTPSFFVYDGGNYFCFGCHAKGDVIEWVKRTENLEFAEAMQTLALRAGVKLSGSRSEAASESNALRAVLEETLRFFQHELERSSTAKEYTKQRGLDADTIARWEIGYAPEFEESLIRHLRSQGTSLATARDAGVISGDEKAGYRDFFRSRLMFPIRDEASRLVAFGGRILGPGEPKYVNSREVAGLFDKGQTLYGLNRARGPIQERKQAVLCEGYLDVIACHRAGVTNAVAPLGTGFTVHHARKIKRYAEKVVALFDGDKAGRAAAKRATELCLGMELDARIATLPEGADPDTLVAHGESARLRERVESPTTLLRFEIREMTAAFGEGAVIGDMAFWVNASRLLSKANPVEADMVIVELAAKHPSAKYELSAAMTAIRMQVEAARQKPKPQPRQKPGARRPTAINSSELPAGFEKPILRAALSETFRERAWPLLSEDGLIISPLGRRLADALIGSFESAPPGATELIFDALEEDAVEIARQLERPAEAIYDRPAEGDLSVEVLDAASASLRDERNHRAKMRSFHESGDLAALSEYLRARAGDVQTSA